MHRNHVQFYLRTDPKDKSGRYISKHDHNKIKKYLQKKYDEQVYSMICSEKMALETFITNSDRLSEQVKALYSDMHEEIKQYILPIDISDSDYIRKWLAEDYTPKPISDDIPQFITNNGEQVRSKSELMIANTLYSKKIPYKYECPLRLANGHIIHPDFTILDTKKRCDIYWEHRGMMDDVSYVKHTVIRLKDYAKINIYPGDRLIITEESASSPLGTNEITGIIKHYFG